MIKPVHSVAETISFTRRRAILSMSVGEYDAMLDVYSADPTYGVIVVGTGGLRKGRVAKAASGKSGGYRVFSLYLKRDVPVYLLWLIDKVAEENISAEQKKAFRNVIAQIRTELNQ